MKKISLLILVASLVILPFLVIAQSSEIRIPENTGLPYPIEPITAEEGPVVGVLVFFMKWILTVFAILAVIAFVITGIMYFLSIGGADAANAKKAFQYSILAVAVTAGSLVIIWTIDYLLKGF